MTDGLLAGTKHPQLGTTDAVGGRPPSIARLDRLARNVALISKLMESDVDFVAADFPQANRLTIHILAAIAEYEARLISERVKAAIAASKARGVVWGGNRSAPTAHLGEARRLGNEGRRRRAVARAVDLKPLLMEMRDSGKSLKGIAAELNRLGIRQRRGGINWTPNAVRWALRWSEPLFPARKMEQTRARYGWGADFGRKLGALVFPKSGVVLLHAGR